ncbi:MAG: Holliday junction branch migration DNA helicase RuvB [Chlamydiia bacterium]|nr:Holliday junction branch migration DNA helicase RuvB [Chlamydiia bacterium]
MSNHRESFIESTLAKEDFTFEIPLRPQKLAEFAGQEDVKERLSVLIGAAKERGDPLGHLILSGPPGLGKTTLAGIISKEMGSTMVVTSGPMLERPADLAGVLSNLKKGDFLFIDEIHRLNVTVEEYLYPAMEDFVLDLMIDSGPNARSVQLQLAPFTLIGATTRVGLLSAPLRSRFSFNSRLNYYNPEILQRILTRSSGIIKMKIEKNALLEIAKRSRGTPRIANHLLKWVRDYAQMRASSPITHNIALKALEMLSIDEKGLDEMDKQLLTLMIDSFGGGPVGVNTLSIAVGETAQTLEEVHEPFLIMQGFLQRTPRGRVVTPLAYTHLGKPCPSELNQNKRKQ